MVETKLAKNKGFDDWNKYDCFKRNSSKGKSGLMCAFKKGTFLSVRDVTHTDDERVLTCRVECKNEVVRVVTAYGPQENEDAEDRKDFFIKFGIEIEKCIHSGDGVIVVGDLNAKLEHNKERNEINPDSGNGSLLLDIIEDLNLQVVNFSDQCKGQWTWSKVINEVVHKSILDYVLVDSKMHLNVVSMDIDEEKHLCPFHRVRVKGGGHKLIYSDHSPLVCKFSLQRSHVKTVKEPRLIITAKGLQKFEEITEDFKYKGNSNDYGGFEKEITDNMDRCFKKVWRKKETAASCCSSKLVDLLKVLIDYKKKGKIQRLIMDKYINRVHMHIAEKTSKFRKRKVDQTVKQLTIDGQFSPNEFQKIRKLLCPKSKMGKTSVILENGDEVFGDEAIREAYREEFVNRLSHNKIHNDYGRYEELTNQLCALYIEEAKKVIAPDFTFDEVTKIIHSLKDKKAANIPNEIWKHAGRGLVNEIVTMLNCIKNSIHTPEQWNHVIITTLFKNKGSKKYLVNFRGIFLTASMSKIFEKLVMGRHEDSIKTVSLNQNGATKGKSTSDNTYLVNACIDHAKYLNKPVYLGLYDFQQCFDKLWLEDCLIGMWKIGIRDQMLALILSLNKNAEITINTPCGKTRSFKVETVVKQGTVIGPQLCKVSTAEYGNDTPGFQIGAVNIKPPIFVDDIISITGNAADMDDAHDKALCFRLQKRSEFGKTKCVGMVVNSKQSDVSPVLKIEDHEMEFVTKAKYVGDIYNNKGTNADLIVDRVKNGTGKMRSILALCEESGLGRYTVCTLILLYKTAFIMSLIFNCQGWSHLTQDNILSLEKIQLKFLKLALWLPLSTSNVFIFLEYGILPLGHEIHRRRLIYLHHILTLGDDDPVKLTYYQQLKLTYEPNWANNIKHIRTIYELSETDLEISGMSKNLWKKVVSQKVESYVFEELVATASCSSKIAGISYSKWGTQEYLLKADAPSCRKIARLRSRTFSCKVNHKTAYDGKTMFCRAGCTDEESQEHLINCPRIQNNAVEIDVSFIKKLDVQKDWAALRIVMDRLQVIEEFAQ